MSFRGVAEKEELSKRLEMRDSRMVCASRDGTLMDTKREHRVIGFTRARETSAPMDSDSSIELMRSSSAGLSAFGESLAWMRTP